MYIDFGIFLASGKYSSLSFNLFWKHSYVVDLDAGPFLQFL